MAKVKICGLTRAVDVEKAIELGADALGFVFEPTSPRCISDPLAMLQLLFSVPPFMPTVGVYGRYWERRDPCSLLQSVHFETDSDRPTLIAVRFTAGTSIDEARLAIHQTIAQCSLPYGLVIDGFSPHGFGGTGHRADWELIAELAKEQAKLVLAGGLTPDNVASAIEAVNPYAVDVSSGIESSAGIKDHVKMRDFIQAAKAQ